MKVAFVTDSGTGQDVATLKKQGIFSVPLQINCGNENFQDLEDISLDEIYEKMKEGYLLSTSLPSPGKIEAVFQSLKDEGYTNIFAVPICSGLSGTANTMQMIAEQIGITFDYVDCYVTAIAQHYMITLAKKLYDEGTSYDDMKHILENIVDTTDTLLLPNDLDHLSRGGRLTPLAAKLGGLLKIKPILRINKKTGGKIDSIGKARTMNRAMENVINILKEENINDEYAITIAHADDEVAGNIYLEKMKEAFPHAHINIIKLVSVVGVHTGRGCQAVQVYKLYKGEVLI